MIEVVNITLYIVLSIIVYLFLLLYSAILIYEKAGKLYLQLISWLKSLIKKNDNVEEVFKTLRNKVTPQIKGAFSVALNSLNTFSLFIDKFEQFNKQKGGYYPAEAVNYSALALRKLYDGSPQVWLVYSSVAIVVFYFILTVF